MWLWLALAVIAAGVATTLAADFPRVAWRDLRTVIVEPALLFLVLLSVMRDRADAQRLGVALVLGAVVSAVVALALIPTGAVVTDAGPPRLRGLFGSPNNLALILERALPVTVGLALAVATRPRLRTAAWAAAAVLRGGVGAHLQPRRLDRRAGRPCLRPLPRLAPRAAPCPHRRTACRSGFDRGGGHHYRRSPRPAPAPLRRGHRRPTPALGFRLAHDRRQPRPRRRAGQLPLPLSGLHPTRSLGRAQHLARAQHRPRHLAHAGHPRYRGTGRRAGRLRPHLARRAAAQRRRQSSAFVYGLGGAMLATLAHGIVDSSLYLPELAATFWVVVALTVMLASSKLPPLAASGPTKPQDSGHR